MRTFSDPDDYATTIRGGIVELTVTGRGDFNAKLTRVDLHSLWLQRFSENLSRIVHAANMPGRAMVQFRTVPGAILSLGGLEIGSTAILRHGEADTYHHRSSGSVSFAAVSLPVEQALIEALVHCLDAPPRGANSLAQGQHAVVMRRFRRAVEESSDQSLYIPEICKAIGVSESTLRMCCQEHLGMSPKRYLLLRRMGLARRALRQAEPDATSVTAVGTRYGFWELGRFAVVYQSLFGESPSATLRRQPE